MSVHKINFSKDEVPKLSWWDNLIIPKFNHLKNIELKILKVDSVVCKNEKGQVINTARALGVNKVNASNIRENLLAKGVNTDYIPGVVIRDTLELIDGFTRQSVLDELEQSEWVYVVGDLAKGSTIEDAKDELGLGLNDHDPSLKSDNSDFRSRLRGWIERQDDYDPEAENPSIPTFKECKDWVNAISHSFTQESVSRIVSETINGIETDFSMESFDKVSAKKRGAKLLDLKKNDVLTFDNKSGASFDRCFIDLIKHYDKYNQFPVVVGFTNRTPSKDALSTRIRMKKMVDSYNETIRCMFKEYRAAEKRGDATEFEVIKLKGFLPQIIDGEDADELVTV